MKTTFKRLTRSSLVFASISLLIGCASAPNDMPDVAEVSGQVTYNGEALADARVTFQPESGRPSTATTDADGKYTLMYNENTPGAKIGKHTVRISKTNDTKDASGEVVKSEEMLPAKFNRETTLEKTVEDKENVIDFDLQP